MEVLLNPIDYDNDDNGDDNNVRPGGIKCAGEQLMLQHSPSSI